LESCEFLANTLPPAVIAPLKNYLITIYRGYANTYIYQPSIPPTPATKDSKLILPCCYLSYKRAKRLYFLD
jgi:hypothetical protein